MFQDCACGTRVKKVENPCSIRFCCFDEKHIPYKTLFSGHKSAVQWVLTVVALLCRVAPWLAKMFCWNLWKETRFRSTSTLQVDFSITRTHTTLNSLEPCSGKLIIRTCLNIRGANPINLKGWTSNLGTLFYTALSCKKFYRIGPSLLNPVYKLVSCDCR